MDEKWRSDEEPVPVSPSRVMVQDQEGGVLPKNSISQFFAKIGCVVDWALHWGSVLPERNGRSADSGEMGAGADRDTERYSAGLRI
ncbi:hypothetical protein AB0K15_17180 [Amycolatopsis sp. NPDC049253]|uniref:hypothetical protein n=1 Tax=Amycolatopsis sp. NPDC049253 TaxID=3155274 RepID=UPI00341F1D8A